MTTQQNRGNPEYLPLNTHMVSWPSLESLLDGVIQSVEKDVWQEHFEDQPPDDELDERNPNDATECITPLKRVTEAIPRIRDLLNEAYYRFDLPDYIMTMIENHFEGSIEWVIGELTPEERSQLDELTKRAIETGE